MKLRPEVVQLVAVRRRLELLLKAHYGREFSTAADPSRRLKWWERFFSDARSAARSPEPVPAIDAEHILLPLQLPASDAGVTAAERYRLLAVAGAERMTRGSLAAHAACETRLERELLWVREGVLIDAAIVRRFPALASAIVRARERTLAARPKPASLAPRERAVEQLIAAALRANPSEVPAEFAGADSSSASAAWAAERARQLAPLHRDFTGTAPVGHWGACPHEPGARPPANPMMLPGDGIEAAESDAPGEGTPDEQREDPEGDPSRDAGDANNRDESGPGIGDAYDSARRYPRRRGTPHQYPEWDGDRHRYVADVVTVWTEVAESSSAPDDRSADAAVMSRKLRSEFERLRVQRETSRRQFSGDALDLPAITDALVDVRMGRTPDERLYERTRANRRTLAIGVLVDVSGSTGNPLSDGVRIIDLERQALLMAHDALEAIGDPYAMFAFAGLGARDVQVVTLKGFDERGTAAPARVRALQPDQNTRLGAAIRHVSQVLATQPATHQLLLVITDGRPNDIGYHEEYAVADSRRAVLDARNQGTNVFGLAIDFEDHAYLAGIFGTSGYVYVRDPHSLGKQLLRSIAQMLRA